MVSAKSKCPDAQHPMILIFRNNRILEFIKPTNVLHRVLKTKNPMHCLLQSREQHTVPDETHPNWEGG